MRFCSKKRIQPRTSALYPCGRTGRWDGTEEIFFFFFSSRWKIQRFSFFICPVLPYPLVVMRIFLSFLSGRSPAHRTQGREAAICCAVGRCWAAADDRAAAGGRAATFRPRSCLCERIEHRHTGCLAPSIGFSSALRHSISEVLWIIRIQKGGCLRRTLEYGGPK